MMLEKAIEADRRRLDACLAADTEALSQLMAAGCLYIHTAGNIDSKETFISKVKDGSLKYQRIANTVEHTVEVADMAAIAGILEMDILRAGTPASIRIRYCCTWTDTEVGTQMVTWQSTPLP